jgi:hypothetical protein
MKQHDVVWTASGGTLGPSRSVSDGPFMKILRWVGEHPVLTVVVVAIVAMSINGNISLTLGCM